MLSACLLILYIVGGVAHEDYEDDYQWYVVILYLLLTLTHQDTALA